MGQLYAIRYPRGGVADLVNECLNPSFEVDISSWTYLWSGTSGAATNARLATGFAKVGGYVLSKTWTTAPTGSAVLAGFQYTTGWAAGATKSVIGSMQANGHNQFVGIQIDFLDAGGAQIGQVTSSSFAAIAGGWTPVWAEGVTAPTGAVTANVKFGLFAGAAAPAVGDSLWLDAVAIFADTVKHDYFDGNTAAAGLNTYTWAGTPGKSASYRNVPDPRTDVRPVMVLGYDTNRPANNVVHQLLSGNVGATLWPAGLRAGTLRFLFDDPAAAAVAEWAHAGVGVWQFADDDNPAEGMTYVVDSGGVRSYQDETRKKRVVEIQYREITA